MVPGGVTEVICHFGGYLKIIDDIARDRIQYDDLAFRSLKEDYTTPRPNYVYRPDLDELESRGMRVPQNPLFEQPHTNSIIPLKSFPDSLPWPEFDHEVLSGTSFRWPGGGGGGGGGRASLEIKVEYQPGGAQSQVEIEQYNVMLDNDSLLISVNGYTYAGGSFFINTSATIESMVNGANAEIPEQWWIPKTGTGVTDFVTAYDESLASADDDDEPDPNSVEPGYYLNGVLQTDPPPPGELTLSSEPPPPPDFGEGLGQWAVAGGNNSTNAALIVDLAASGRSMIVMGDYFKTNAIFQTNSTMDHDYAEVSGAPAPGITSGGSEATNIADFVQHPGVHASLSAFFAGPNWSVDVVDGNYYNIHTLVQMNYLSDNDILVQRSSDTHYEAHTGANGQLNLAQIFEGSFQYDLIIVAGAYHGLNVIYQNNILLNNDQIRMLTDGTSSSQSGGSGGNNLANTASIENYGGYNFQPMNGDLTSLVGAIAAGLTTLDPSFGNFVDGSGGVFNVLYVTGDYYDVNAIWQTNVVSDVNVLVQLLNAPSPAALEYFGGPVTQSITTGGNVLINDATIVDVNPTTTYVNGEVYGDTILVQADLLPVEDSGLAADTASLVPELIAFVNESQDEPQNAPVGAPLAVHEDPIASVMH